MKAVYVEWRDSAFLSGWRDVEGFAPCIIRTLGWLVEEEEDFIIVSAHEDGAGTVSCPISIPMESVTLLQYVEFES